MRTRGHSPIPARHRRLLGLGVFVLSLLLPLGAVAHSAGQIDIRGDWSMPAVAGGATYPQVWSILTENLATGAWKGHIKGNASYTLDGTVSGTTLTIHSQSGSYQSYGQATLVRSGAGWKVTGGTFHDTNGTKGTFSGTRLSGPPGGGSGGGSGSKPPQACLGGCASGTSFAYPQDPQGLSWDDKSWDFTQGGAFPVASGCGSAVRGLASTRASQAAADGSSCSVDATIDQTTQQLQQMQQLLQQDYQNALDIMKQMGAGDPALNQDVLAVNDLVDGLQKIQQNDYQNARTLEDAVQRMDTLPDDFTPADQALAADFSTVDAFRVTQSAQAAQAATLPDAHLVLGAVLAKSPTKAQATAFKAALRLANSASADPSTRGKARLTLLIAGAAARGEIRLEAKGKAIVVAHATAKVKAKSKHKLALRPSALGGRVLRLAAIAGIKHPAHLRLTLRSTKGGHAKSATKSIALR